MTYRTNTFDTDRRLTKQTVRNGSTDLLNLTHGFDLADRIGRTTNGAQTNTITYPAGSCLLYTSPSPRD